MTPSKHCYNDGVVRIYRNSDRATDFGARKNVHSVKDMILIAKLDYAEQSKRQQDIEFAEQMGFSLALKIKTLFIKAVDNKCKCVIEGCLYDIYSIDKTRTEMFLYLQEVGKIAE